MNSVCERYSHSSNSLYIGEKYDNRNGRWYCNDFQSGFCSCARFMPLLWYKLGRDPAVASGQLLLHFSISLVFLFTLVQRFL